jgi:hypothetical protein
MTLRVSWHNHLGLEIARCHGTNQRDAAEQLIAMINDAGCEIEEGDSFQIIGVVDEEEDDE